MLVPDTPGAVWYPLLGYFDTLEVHPKGTRFCTFPARGTYATGDLQLAGHEGGPKRVFIRGTPWPVIAAYKAYSYSARHRLVTFRKPVNGHSQPLEVVVYSNSDLRKM